MRVAIVHDYLTQMGGAERVVASLHGIFPDAPIFTTVLDPEKLAPALRDADIRATWLQRVPGVLQHFRAFLPLYPLAIESIRLAEYDVVVSSSSGFALGARAAPGALHICYSHTPARFLYQYERYVDRQNLGRAARALLPPVITSLRWWDRRAARRPTAFLANSSVTAQRIRRWYGRPSTIVFPPVDVGKFQPSSADGGYYLVVARLLPYKRIDVAVRAFNHSGRKLLVVGDGPDRRALEAMAGPTVCFAGRVGDHELPDLYAGSRGLVLPGEEDFGIAPLEANASGRPVIAFRAGGALDTVVENRTGVFFARQTETALNDAIALAETIPWDAGALRRHAEQFAEPVFRRRLLEVLERLRAGQGCRPLAGPQPTVPPESA